MTAIAVILMNVLQGFAVTGTTTKEVSALFAVHGIPINSIHFNVWLSFKIEELSAIISCANLSTIELESSIVTMIFFCFVGSYIVGALVHDDVFDTLISASFQHHLAELHFIRTPTCASCSSNKTST